VNIINKMDEEVFEKANNFEYKAGGNGVRSH